MTSSSLLRCVRIATAQKLSEPLNLTDLESYLRGRWHETSDMLQHGVDRNGNSALPDSGTFTGSLVRSLDGTPDYVQHLFQLARQHLEALDNSIEDQIGEEPSEQFDTEEKDNIVLPEGTGRATLFLLTDFED